MSGFIQGEDRFQATLFPERLDDYVAEDSAVRVINVFLDDLCLSAMPTESTMYIRQRATRGALGA